MQTIQFFQSVDSLCLTMLMKKFLIIFVKQLPNLSSLGYRKAKPKKILECLQVYLIKREAKFWIIISFGNFFNDYKLVKRIIHYKLKLVFLSSFLDLNNFLSLNLIR